MAHLTVIIPAYNAQAYIEECLDSICAQILQPDRVVVGVDGCKKTHDKLMKIGSKYQNLTVVYYKKNKGTYVTFNSLMDYVQDYFITFGADDMAHPDMTLLMMKNTPCLSAHSGVMCMRKSIMQKMGGWRDWRIAADTDMHVRLKRAGVYLKVLPMLYEYRQHEGQLTKMISYNSKEREDLKNIIKTSKQVYIKPVSHD